MIGGIMRYYDLDENGKIKGSYAIPQPGINLILLDDAPENYKLDITTQQWIPDQEAMNQIAINIRKKQDIVLAKDIIKSIGLDIEKVKSIDELKIVVLKLAEQIKILTENL